MLSPDYILRLTEGAEEIAGELHEDIIRRIVERIMIRIGRGDDYLLTPIDKWQLETLQEAGYLREELQKEIAKRTKLQYSEIRGAFEAAGVETLRFDNAVYAAAELPVIDSITQSPFLTRLMQRAYEATLGEWDNYTRTTADAAQRLFIRQCDRAYQLVASGAVSYTQAVKEAVNTIVEDGVEVTYPSGHIDTIETATLRAVRTGVSQACGQVTMAHAAETGVSLFLTSAHLGARPSHELWQGEVFWVDWTALHNVWPWIVPPDPREATPEERAKYREFVRTTEIGTVTGLMGANCRHHVSPFIDGVSYVPKEYKEINSEENQKAYELSQRQRALERRISKTKRAVMGLKSAVDNAEGGAKAELEAAYQRKAALLQKQNKEYNQLCEENNLKRLQDRLSVAKWDRKQAAAATAAARKAGAPVKESAHAIERQTERKVSQAAIDDAMKNPLHIGEKVIDSQGRASVKYIGKDATVCYNPDNKTIVTVWKTGTKERRKYE